MRSNWWKIRRLQRLEKWAFVQSLFLLPVMAFALRFLGFRRCLSVLAGVGIRQSVSDGESLKTGRSIARMVRVAASYGPYHATCLPQALTVWLLLLRRGITSDVRIGVRKVCGELEAHAWVECQGAVLNELADVRVLYAPFDRALSPVGVISP